MTATGQVFGTPSYMSPEQLMAKNVDHRTDLFSLGVLMYEIITGKKPFAGENIQSITYAIVNSPVTFPNGTPAGITGILRRALAKDPEQRYPNAQAMATDVRMELSFLGSQYTYPNPTTPPAASPQAISKPVDVEEPAPVDGDATTVSAPASGQVSPVAGATNVSNSSEQVRRHTSFVPQPSTYYPTIQPVGNSIATLVASISAIVALIAIVGGFAMWTIRDTRLASEHATAINYYNAGSVALDNNDPQTAVSDYIKATRLAPPDETLIDKAQRNLAIAYVALGDQVASTDPASAQTYYKKALATGDRSASVRIRLAQVSADPAEAIKEYELAITDDPSGPYGDQARKAAAVLYLKQGDNAMDNHDATTARDSYNRVIELIPTDALAQEARQRLTSAGL
jgi:serine/threonine-protein kinase